MGEARQNGNLNGQIWQSADEVLARFDKNKDKALDLEEFRDLCFELFGPGEVEQHGDKIADIFQALDTDADGFLRDQEWQTCYDKWLMVIVKPVNVFVIVDVQNDFIDGTLALRDLGLGQDGRDVVEPINRLIQECSWDKIIYTLDCHPSDHISFYDNLHLRELHPDSKIKKNDAKLFDTVLFLKPKIEQKLWPVHCVFDTWGVELHKDLIVAPNSVQVKKGQDTDMDSYSAFFDNSAEKATELPRILEELGATDVYTCGLAFDVCVCSTSLDGLRLGYRVALVENCCRGVSPAEMLDARRKVTERGGLILQADRVKAQVEGRARSLVMALQGARALAKRQALLRGAR